MSLAFQIFLSNSFLGSGFSHTIWPIWLMLYGAYSTTVDYGAWTGPELEHIRGVCLAPSKLMISFVWRHLKAWWWSSYQWNRMGHINYVSHIICDSHCMPHIRKTWGMNIDYRQQVIVYSLWIMTNVHIA